MILDESSISSKRAASQDLPAAGFFAAGFVSAVTALFTASSGTLAAAL